MNQNNRNKRWEDVKREEGDVKKKEGVCPKLCGGRVRRSYVNGLHNFADNIRFEKL